MKQSNKPKVQPDKTPASKLLSYEIGIFLVLLLITALLLAARAT